MNVTEMVSSLSDAEKIDLAAKLTQAAMSHIDFGPLPEEWTNQTAVRESADRAFTVFGYILNHIAEGHQPMRFPERL